MGIETEYGILAGGDEGDGSAGAAAASGVPLTAQELSALVVTAYDRIRPYRSRTRWSYEGEDPLADARGWRLERERAHPSQLTDGVGAALQRRERPTRAGLDSYEAPSTTLVLSNGARLYVDHAHPEYSSPEVTSALDAVRWDRAGEEVVLAAQRALAASPHTPTVRLYKNNVDGKGASYGTHENYLVDRAVPFTDLVTHLTPFLATRPILVGAGRVGLGQRGEEPGFQLSQRADYIEAEVGLETTLRRPIINTRDEPHADPTRFRRLHVIVGDANCFETATYLKLGATSLVLAAIERSLTTGRFPTAWRGLALADPVAAVRLVSRDLTLARRLELADGRHATAWEIQRRILDGVHESLGGLLAADPAEAAVAATWDRLLALLRTDREAAAREIEWVAKLALLERMRGRHQLGWDDTRLEAIDLQWSDVRPERGLARRLRAAGAVATLVGDEEVRDAVVNPPQDTRAWLRGELVRRFPREVAAAGWNDVLLDIPGESTLLRVPLPDPALGTRALLAETLEVCRDAGELVVALGGPAERG